MVEFEYTPVRHEQGVHSYQLNVAVANTSINKALLPITLPLGIIKRVQIYFPDGCRQHVFATIAHSGAQWLPKNVGGAFVSNDKLLDYEVYHEVWSGSQDFVLSAWNDFDTAFGVYIHRLIFTFVIQESAIL